MQFLRQMTLLSRICDRRELHDHAAKIEGESGACVPCGFLPQPKTSLFDRVGMSTKGKLLWFQRLRAARFSFDGRHRLCRRGPSMLPMCRWVGFN